MEGQIELEDYLRSLNCEGFDICDYIPEGRANAVTRYELCMKTGFRDRQIKNEDENDVLFYRYIKGLRWWEISEKMDCSERWVHKLHGRALGHLKYPE